MKNFVRFPDSAEFAFTILDDTDDTTVSNGRPVYDLISELGIKITKTVWALATPRENQGPYFAGETLAAPHYLAWVHELNESGHEIAFHNATMGSSSREDTIRALDVLETQFGSPVRLHCNHGQNLENLHWGINRYSSLPIRLMLKARSLVGRDRRYYGDDPGSEYFWADIADQRIKYIRAFAYKRLNGASLVPGRPFADRSKQKKSLFFNTADAPDVWAFNRLVNPTTLEKLRAERGWAVVSTHLGKGFFRDGKLDEQFVETMKYLSAMPAWSVPVSDLLDYLSSTLGATPLSFLERSRMEYAHIIDRARDRLSAKSPY